MRTTGLAQRLGQVTEPHCLYEMTYLPPGLAAGGVVAGVGRVATVCFVLVDRRRQGRRRVVPPVAGEQDEAVSLLHTIEHGQ